LASAKNFRRDKTKKVMANFWTGNITRAVREHLLHYWSRALLDCWKSYHIWNSN